LPEFQDPKHQYAYNVATGARLAHQLKSANGKVVDTHFYHGRKLRNPIWTVNPTDTKDHKLSPGKHVIKWYLEGKPFYKLPFTVRVIKSNDPNNPGSRYYLDGPWEDYIYFYLPRNKKYANATISIWMRDENAAPGNWGQPDTEITLSRNGEVIGGWPGVGGTNPLQLKPWYTRFDLGLRNKKGGLKAKDLLQDGTYEVSIKTDGKVFASYQYTAKGGKFVDQERQIREKTDPMLFIEGGGERFFMKRK
jgi:hypothetical protein